MRISLAQVDIVWENAPANLKKYKEMAASLKGKSDLLVLPEMCANGFGSEATKVAQYNDGLTISTLRATATENDLAIVGSFIAKEDVTHEDGQSETLYFNRGFFIYPDGKTIFFDKRHLFRVGVEGKDYQAGSLEPCIVRYKDWNIRLIICYDLRFPVWCRNVQQGYDLLICVANWPECRIQSWNNMLEARATENQAYACGVNRIGNDGLDLHYNGASAVYSAIGEELGRCHDNEEEVLTLHLDLDRLRHQREKFPAWKDADIFEISGGPADREIQLIGFDADDTLWLNSIYFIRAEKALAEILSPYIDAENLHRRLVAIEAKNMPWYGYGVMAYTLSLMETALQVSEHRLSGEDMEKILNIGQKMLAQEVQLYAGVKETLAKLSKHYPLILITKGDMLDQERKLKKSGLQPYFDHIEIVTEKHPEQYREILSRLHVSPEHFLMVGNSYKSDIIPVLEIGAQAIHTKDDSVWEWEKRDCPDNFFHEIEQLPELLDLLGIK